MQLQLRSNDIKEQLKDSGWKQERIIVADFVGFMYQVSSHKEILL
uniref:Uncharacterized protein n=1 Tax=Arundo donax TaxID=35708 RepID=A0A0A9FVP2_ARUDO